MGQIVDWLLLDLNSFFASCEQQINPKLRGRPVAVVPMMAETTCAIAASYEAKRFGVKTGTLVRDARVLCPDIIFVLARHRAYIEFHHQILAAIEKNLPIEKILSIDEMACRLLGRQRSLEEAIKIAKSIKETIHKTVGACLTSSIGLAPNIMLAKLASDMEKPNGLVVLAKDDLVCAMERLTLRDFPGIGPRMEERLIAAGIHDARDLWRAEAGHLRRIWGGIEGLRFHALLHGADIALPFGDSGVPKTISHQHVLPPELRHAEGARNVIWHLVEKGAVRLRRQHCYARRLSLHIKWLGGIASSYDETSFQETNDTVFLLHQYERLWRGLPPITQTLKPLRVGMVLGGLVHEEQHQPDLFAGPRPTQGIKHRASDVPLLMQAVDRLNEKYGRRTVIFGPQYEDDRGSKIAFQRVPELYETDKEHI
jgi:DNA polymerase IV